LKGGIKVLIAGLMLEELEYGLLKSSSGVLVSWDCISEMLKDSTRTRIQDLREVSEISGKVSEMLEPLLPFLLFDVLTIFVEIIIVG